MRMKFIDSYLNNITMYRLLVYYLVLLLLVAGVVSLTGGFSFTIVQLVMTTLFILSVSRISNEIFAFCFDAIINVESVYITALILALIVSPAQSFHDLVFVGWVALLAVASKFILAIKKKHLFNPAAIAVVLTAVGINQSATWWIATLPMFPFVLIGGLLVIRKIRRFDLFVSFIVAATFTIGSLSLAKGTDILSILQRTFVDSPILFLGFVMLTEPLTTPPTKRLQIMYGAIVGFLSSPQIRLAGFYTTPEIALVIGNCFSYLVSPKEKFILTLKEKIQIATDAYDFLFTANTPFRFAPGQYMEWTLSHDNTDSRGNRRYFTLASSPSEKDIRIGVKFYEPSSSYKKALLAMDKNTKIVAAQLAGDFTLSDQVTEKSVFIAGGIGITPFRSMIQHMIDTNQNRDFVLLYSNKKKDEISYSDVFTKAHQLFGSRIRYTLTDTTNIPSDWNGLVGRIDEKMITSEVPDWQVRTFYISGTNSMVTATHQMLLSLGVPNKNIKTDFFPGFA
ncbi:oxidoreductase [Candidatus Woesebacteria bacterium]|nr:oxidoreductase [Candidatus Woesebacteria bacterium]MBP9687113.1 oxidoreductase [Candidatus Woesebacteria bacterium]